MRSVTPGPCFDEDLILFSNQILSDMVEAAVRANDADAATLALDRLGARAPASGARGLPACSLVRAPWSPPMKTRRRCTSRAPTPRLDADDR